MFTANVTIDGIRTEGHEVTEILHTRNATFVTVCHYVESEQVALTSHMHELDFSLNFESAEAWVCSLEDYAEPESGVVSIEDLVWQAGRDYTVDEYVIYDSVVYKVIQAHTSQDDWTPDVAPSLFARALAKPNEVLPWEQPDTANPYMTGDRVLFDGNIYESIIDNNVWSPADYPAGWLMV